MEQKKHGRPRVLSHELARLHPGIERLDELISSGRVLVDGRPILNPRPPECALPVATCGLEHAGWPVLQTMPSPATGARGAIEFLVDARRERGRPDRMVRPPRGRAAH